MSDQQDKNDEAVEAMRAFQAAALRFSEDMADMATVAARMQMLMIEDASNMIETIRAAQAEDDREDIRERE